MAKYVHCNNLEEWNYACKILKRKTEIGYCDYGDCINLQNPENSYFRANLDSFDTIYTFKDWLKLNNLSIEKKSMKEIMFNVLKKTYDNLELRNKCVPLFMSNPGQGKTSIIEEFFEEHIKPNGNKMVTMILPNLMPNEAVGGVYPNPVSKIWEFYDSEKLASLNDGDLLFLDEVFNGTLKQTLDSMLNVLGQRRLGSGKTMANVLIVAASNLQGLINLTPQIKERFQRIDLTFNSEEYEEILKNRYGMPNSISTHLCNIIKKEKFEHDGWNYSTARSIEKAILKIGNEISTTYDEILLPFLSLEIKLDYDVQELNYKAGDDIKYLEILKLICKYKKEEYFVKESKEQFV